VQQFSGWGSTLTSGYLGDRFVNKTALMLAVSMTILGLSYFVLGLANTYGLILLTMLFVGIGPSLYHAPALGSLSRRFTARRAFVISLHGTGGSLGEVLGPLIAAGAVAVLYWQDVLKLSLLPALIGAATLWLLLKDDRAQAAGTTSLRSYMGSFFGLLRQRALLMVCLVSAFRSVGQATTAIFLPIYLREDLGYSAGLVGLYLSMAQLAGIGSQPLMGFLSDRLGHKRVLIPAMSAFALLLLIVPLAEGKLQLAIVILALGAFLFSLHAILISAAAELAGDEVQSTIVSLIFAAGFLGSLAPTIAGVLADAYGIKVTFVFSAVCVAIGTLVLAATRLPAKTRSGLPT
jgi:FSR family fosmidomycin resistance protein-like MFS transporter